MNINEATKLAIEEYYDKDLRSYALPYGGPGDVMFDTIEQLIKRDSDIIAKLISNHLVSDLPKGTNVVVRAPGTRICDVCDRLVESINYDSHMGVMHTPAKPVETPEAGWWDGDWASLEASVRALARDEWFAIVREQNRKKFEIL